MFYRSVGKRTAVNFNDLNLPICEHVAIEILIRAGFKVKKFQPVEIVSTARKLVNKSNKYRRGAFITEAPKIFDCSTFTKYLYGLQGVWLPRHSIDQRELLPISVEQKQAQAGDLVFTTGKHNYYWQDENDGVGHVGVYTGDNTVIHSSNFGIRETEFEFFSNRNRGIKRLSNTEKLFVVTTPKNRIVECSREFRWIILQNC